MYANCHAGGLQLCMDTPDVGCRIGVSQLAHHSANRVGTPCAHAARTSLYRCINNVPHNYTSSHTGCRPGAALAPPQGATGAVQGCALATPPMRGRLLRPAGAPHWAGTLATQVVATHKP